LGEQKGRRQDRGDAHHNLNDRYERVNTGYFDVRKRHHYRDNDHEDGEAANCNLVLPGVCRQRCDHDWKIVSASAGTHSTNRGILHNAQSSGHETHAVAGCDDIASTQGPVRRVPKDGIGSASMLSKKVLRDRRLVQSFTGGHFVLLAANVHLDEDERSPNWWLG
jgi:hypothetical protein